LRKEDEAVSVPRRVLAFSAAVAAAVLAVCGCGSKTASGSSSGVATTTDAALQVFQHRSLACGTGIDGPAQPSGPSDAVQLTIGGTHLNATEIDASYAITTSADHPSHEIDLTLPIGPTPLTILLLKDGKIVGKQGPPASTGTVDGAPATGYNLSAKPYTGSAKVGQLCPGTSWEQVAANHSRYTVAVLMSRQPQGGPQTSPPPAYLPDPLTVATAAL
jgi:hypothetical protein